MLYVDFGPIYGVYGENHYQPTLNKFKIYVTALIIKDFC